MASRKTSPNVEMLCIVARGIKKLKEKVVFVGGATVDLFVTDPAAPATRATYDVDCVVELARRVEYNALEEELRLLGFEHPAAKNAPICRWIFKGIEVDVMPTEGAILGFSNRWYRDGMAGAEQVALPNGERVRVFSVSFLLASKLEAFRDRGHEDFQASKDLEDVIAVLDGCPEVEGKIRAAPADVRRYLGQEFGRMLADERFLPSLDGHLSPSAGREERVKRCVELMRRIAGPTTAA